MHSANIASSEFGVPSLGTPYLLIFLPWQTLGSYGFGRVATSSKNFYW
jgi:hypothetical protein